MHNPDAPHELDRATFAAELMGLAAIANRDLTTPVIELYWRACRMAGLTRAEFQEAVSAALLADSPFMPTPGQLVASVRQSATQHAVEAWGRVLGAAAKHGRYASVDFGPEMNAAIRVLGGWIQVCNLSERDLPFAQRRFAEALEAYERSTPSEDQGARLEGLTEQHGSPFEPVAIGPGTMSMTRRLGAGAS